MEVRSQDYIKFVHWFLAILNQHGIEGKEILSLACGSCLAETILASRGFQIIGIDLSEGMLIEAKKNIQNNSIKLIRGDMSNIPIKKNFNAVIAHYFSLNYLTDISHL
ncbi:MAG: class I SAM-dependent methyltransferase, partial [Acidobacteria bacterium]|nr:class I SAM-dependent methyltransferase [Acidobacteriota bacterium]